MTNILKKIGLGTALAATALGTALPAQAQRWHGGGGWHRGGGDTTGAAILGGIVGLGVGAAIASSNNRDRYYDRRYYNDGYYNGGNGYYRDGYYNGYDGYRGYNGYRGYDRGCYVQRRWDPYYGEWVRVRVCR